VAARWQVFDFRYWPDRADFAPSAIWGMPLAFRRSRTNGNAFEELAMESRIEEMSDGIYRLSIFEPEVAAPAGFTCSHFPILGEEPLLFHSGRRKMFRRVSEPVARIIPVDRLRWLAFVHFEADEADR
jgi:hypothetical protein